MTGTRTRLWGRGGFLLLLSAYLLIHLVLRLALTPTVGVDDVEQAIMAQSWSWGYNPRQPPLYTWLLYGLFQITGVSLFTLQLLRYLLLFAAFWLLYLSAERVLEDARLASLALYSYALIYAIGWGAHQGFTHTLMLMVTCAATFYLVLRLPQARGVWIYAALGAVAGLGMLSKYSYALFAAALLVATLTQEPFRRRILDWRLLVSVAVAAAIALPHVLWVEGGATSFAALYAQTLQAGREGSYPGGVASGLLSLVESVVLFLLPLALFYAIYFPRAVVARENRAAVRPDLRTLLARFFIAVFAIMVAAILMTGVTAMQSRWMHPVLLLFPIYFFCRVRDVGLKDRSVRWFVHTVVVAAAIAIGFQVAQITIGPPLCKKCRLLMPYAQLARQIDEAGFTAGTIVAEDEHVGGNFRVHFPDSRVIVVSYRFYVAPPREESGQCLIVWHVRERAGIPADLAGFLATRLDVRLRGAERIRTVQADMLYAGKRPLRLAYVLLPEGRGRCR